jgi:alpha-1,3-rhamnosyl/mannosyltransferase
LWFIFSGEGWFSVRVVVNQTAALGKRTGIGHYAVELVRCLREQAGPDQINSFPPRWLGGLRTLAVRAGSWLARRGPARPTETAGPSSGPPGLGNKLLALGRRLGRTMMAARFRSECARNDLYHETNFIPLPTDLPTVTTVHDLSVLRHPEWHPAERVAHFERDFHRGLARSHHFLTISEFGRQEVIRTLSIPPERVTRTYMGIRPGLGPLPEPRVRETLRRLGLPPRYLLCLGTIEPRKNVLRLLQVYCSLPAELRSRWPLLLVGSWGWNTAAVADYFQREARHRGVLYHGYLAEEHLPALYNGARALVYPSRYEGFGLPPIEMMACGGAVLASTAGALVETIGRKAHLVDPDDADGWRAALIRVVEDEDWWQSLRRGAEEVARPFTWDQCAADTLRVYRRLCSELREVQASRPRAA